MLRRSSRLPTQNGEAEIFSTKLPPARTSSSTGSTRYSRLFQKCLSFQTSSQIVKAICRPQKPNNCCARAGAKFRHSSKTSYVGSNIFDWMNSMRPSRNSAAEFITDFPVSASAGVTIPQMTAMPCVSEAILSTVSRLRATNDGRSTRSRGGYPQTASSGKRIRPAPAARACPAN